MALIDKASLLMVPSTYEAGKLYNVLPSGNRAPDSTNQNSGYDQTRADFDFDRGSNAAATRVNASGLIEKYRENQILHSNNFNDSIYSKFKCAFTSGQSGYDGSNNAWKLECTSLGNVYVFQSQTITEIKTRSIYAKAGTQSTITFLWDSYNQNEFATFDLSAGTFTNAGCLANMESVGNGWYRCSTTITDSSNGYAFLFSLSNELGSSPSVGDNIYIQDAQQESGLVATDYLESTSVTGKAGVLVDLPRINYDANGQNGSLLLEPSRQNLITYSEYFGGWTLAQSSVSLTSNASISPEGLQNATEIVWSDNISTQFFQYISAVSGTIYTTSAFVKYKSGTERSMNVGVYDAGHKFITINFNTDGTIASTSTSGTLVDSGYENYGNGWYRVYIIHTGATTGTIEVQMNRIGLSNTTEEFYIYGSQLEANASYPSSYIPTMGTSETRAADVCNGGGNTESINSVEGVLFVETKGENDNTFNYISLNDGGTTNYAGILYTDVDNEIAYRYYVGGSGVQIIVSNVAVTNYNKIAVKWKANDFAIWINGIEVGTASSGSLNPSGTFNELAFARGGSNNTPFYGNVKQVAVFNEALSDSELATLTTL